MSTKCNGCGKPILNLEYLECGTCKQLYDLTCLNIESKSFNFLTAEFKDKWLCPECSSSRPKGDNTHTPIRTSSGNLNSTYTTSEVDNVNKTRGSRHQTKHYENLITNETDAPPELNVLVTEIRELRKEIQELKQPNSEMSLLKQAVYEMREHLSSVSSSLTNKLDTYEERIATQDIEIKTLKENLQQLQFTFNDHEQRYLKNEVEIVGLPELDNENLHHIVMATARKVGVELSDSELEEASRIGPKRTNSSDKETTNMPPRPITVRLLRRTKRDELLKAIKIRRNLTTEDIISGPPKKVYINERLTKANRLLFRETRLRAQKHNYRYCWIRNGTILVREADRRPALIIRTYGDLERYIRPENKQNLGLTGKD